MRVGNGTDGTTANGLPVEIENLSAGPELAALLDGVDRRSLNGYELVLLLQARLRQVSHLQAELLADMVELAYSPPCYEDDPPIRLDHVDELASDEIRAALTWTRRAAETQLDLAWRLVRRLPEVWKALHEGLIDLPKARVLADRTAHVPEDVAQHIVAQVLAAATTLTTGQLRARVDRLCIEADPEGAARRHEERVRERRVEARPDADGTADLFGYDLPADRVAAIMQRIARLARQQRRRHDPRSMDALKADIFMALLEGKCRDGEGAGAVIDIGVDLPTLLGLAERPGEIPGWGPVIADIARQAVFRQPDGEWRVSVVDPDSGAVLWNGTTRRRPTVAQRRHVEARQPTCTFPGCRMPARDSDIDHSVDHALGGPTEVGRLAPGCRHDHGLRHTGGWTFRQPQPGVYRWTSPRGHTYTTYRDPP